MEGDGPREIRINLLPEQLPEFYKALEHGVIINFTFPNLDLRKRFNTICEGLLDRLVAEERIDSKGGIDITDHAFLMLNDKWLDKIWTRIYFTDNREIITVKLTNSSRRILRNYVKTKDNEPYKGF